MGESSTILSQLNAHSSLQALVEEVDGAIYLYLDGPKFGVPYGAEPEEWIPTRCVWVANTDRAVRCTKEEYEAAWKEGKERALPQEFLSKSQMPIDTSKFEFIWSPHGDSVALMQENELLAFIPSSSSNNWGECRGYSSYLGVDECYGMRRFSDMSEYLQIRNHFLGLKSFWEGVCRESNWRQYQRSCLDAYKSHFGEEIKYAAIDSEEVLPKAITIHEKDEILYFMTVGASQLPQPKLEEYAPEFVDYVLVEFGLALTKECVSKRGLETVMRAFMDLVSIPWHLLTFFVPGVTCEFDLFANCIEYQKYTKAILLEHTKILPKITFSHGAKHLWFFPISEEEFASKQKDFSDATRIL